MPFTLACLASHSPQTSGRYTLTNGTVPAACTQLAPSSTVHLALPLAHPCIWPSVHMCFDVAACHTESSPSCCLRITACPSCGQCLMLHLAPSTADPASGALTHLASCTLPCGLWPLCSLDSVLSGYTLHFALPMHCPLMSRYPATLTRVGIKGPYGYVLSHVLG